MQHVCVAQIAKRQAVVNPENTFFSVKRFIGRKMDEIKDESKQVGGACLSHTQPGPQQWCALQHSSASTAVQLVDRLKVGLCFNRCHTASSTTPLAT